MVIMPLIECKPLHLEPFPLSPGDPRELQNKRPIKDFSRDENCLDAISSPEAFLAPMLFDVLPLSSDVMHPKQG